MYFTAFSNCRCLIISEKSMATHNFLLFPCSDKLCNNTFALGGINLLPFSRDDMILHCIWFPAIGESLLYFRSPNILEFWTNLQNGEIFMLWNAGSLVRGRDCGAALIMSSGYGRLKQFRHARQPIKIWVALSLRFGFFAFTSKTSIRRCPLMAPRDFVFFSGFARLTLLYRNV